MINSYEVGAVFNIIDKASPTLKLLADQFNVLDRAIIRTQESLTRFSAQKFTGLGSRLKAINDQMAALGINTEKAFGGVAAGAGEMGAAFDSALIGARALKTEMAEIAALSRRAGTFPAVGGGGFRRGGGGGGGGGRGAGPHFGNFSAPLPGGSHLHMGGNAALAGLGMVGYGVYEEAQLQDAVFQLLYHTGMKGTPQNKDMFRNIIQKAMSETGYDLKDVAEAAKTETRMFKGVPGGGLDVLPEMLRAAAIESRLKGSTLQESMNSLIGLAHMTKEYSPEEIKKLAPAFAFLSASNPARLGSMEKAASYAVPILQSGLEIDPMQSLLLGTVMTRAGATNTKSGTWLRNMLLGAMPGSTIVGDPKKHHDALERLGLIDGDNKPTWFTNGKPDPFKMMEIAGAHAANLPLQDRAATEKQAFGVQGFGAFALLADPAVKEQLKAMRKEMDSDGFKNRYGSFMKEYSEESPVQKFRETWSDLKNVLMDIGSIVLPPLIAGLKGLDDALKWIKENITPAVDGVKGFGAAVLNLVPSASEAVHAMFDFGDRIKGFFGGILDWFKNKVGGWFSPTSLDGGGGSGGGYGGGVIKASLGGGGGGFNEGHANVHAVNPELMARYNAMMAAAPGSVRNSTRITSGYRDNALQAKLYQRYLHGGPLAAPPGHSNHGRGLALDIHDGSGWVHKHAGEFGLGFPLGRRDWPHMQMRGGGHIKPYSKPTGGEHQNLTVMLDGEVIHRSVVKHERRATEHSHQAPTFDGYHDFSAPDGQIWAA